MPSELQTQQWAVAMTRAMAVTKIKPEWSPITTNNQANTIAKATAAQRRKEEEGCKAVITMQGSPSRLHGKICLDEAKLP